MLVSMVYASKDGGLAFKVFDQSDVARKVKIGLYIDGLLIEKRTILNRGERFSVMIVPIPNKQILSVDSILFLRDEDSGEIVGDSLTKVSEVIDISNSQPVSSNQVVVNTLNDKRSIVELLRGNYEA